MKTWIFIYTYILDNILRIKVQKERIPIEKLKKYIDKLTNQCYNIIIRKIKKGVKENGITNNFIQRRKFYR